MAEEYQINDTFETVHIPMDLQPIQGYTCMNGPSRLSPMLESSANQRCINLPVAHSSDSSLGSLSADERTYPKRDSMYSNRSYTLPSAGVASIPTQQSSYPYLPRIASSFATTFSEVPSAMTQNLCLPSYSVSPYFASRPENRFYQMPMYTHKSYYRDPFEYQPPGLFRDSSSSIRSLSAWNVDKGIPDKTPVREQDKQYKRTKRSKKNKVKGSAEHYVIDPQRVLQNKDSRQFLMIKNIPNSFSQEKLLSILEQFVKYQIEFLYLPLDRNTDCNLGYGYVSLVDSHAVYSLYMAMHMKRWPNSASQKLCEIVYARIQGHRDYLKMCDKWEIMTEDTKYHPFFFRRVDCIVNGIKQTRMIRAPSIHFRAKQS